MTLDLSTVTITMDGVGWGTAATRTATAAAETLFGTNANDTVYGQGGADTLLGRFGDDTLFGENDNDRLHGEDGNDILDGGAGDDTLSGGNGDDIMRGGAGLDLFMGGAGVDTASYALNGSNFIVFRDNISYITVRDLTGANGIDRIYADTELIAFADQTIDLRVTSFALNGGAWGSGSTMTGTSSSETIRGTRAQDTIYGLEGDDTIFASAGNDRIFGGDGSDRLYGEDGDDVLVGGAGLDFLDGRGGNDQFGFTHMDAVDRVIDFQSGDTLNITNLLTGFDAGDDIDLFVLLTQDVGSTRFSINADGVGTDFTLAFIVSGAALSSHTAQSIADAGILITNQSLL
jgi:Ca2+-binding RTX toxin-like protein